MMSTDREFMIREKERETLVRVAWEKDFILRDERKRRIEGGKERG